MMKRALILLILLPLILLSLLELSLREESEVEVVVSIPPLKEVVEELSGDDVRAVVLLPENADAHTYEPDFSKMMALSKAKLYIHFGALEFEKEMERKLESENILIINASNGIEVDDPHVWISLKNAEKIVENVFDALCQLHPEKREIYLRNKEMYIKNLRKIDEENRRFFSNRSSPAVLVYHPFLSYMAKEYGFEVISVEKDGKEPSLKDILELREIIELKGIDRIIVPVQHHSEDVEMLCKELGVSPLFVNPLDEDYLKTLEEISRALRECSS
ncbi:MAG: zinc transport system substrate-binding protein [Archaeoglobi archaeon]|nr:zinc transport system substrate-binding protein [Archaeoglobi archaeon]MDK2780981.1 zinc transport system substrate-binding protein [Archaeoglobi archaeon]